MSYPYGNYNSNPNSWEKQSSPNQGRPGASGNQAIQELLKLQQRQIQQGSNNSGRPPPYNPAQPSPSHGSSNGPSGFDPGTLDLLKQAQQLVSQMPSSQQQRHGQTDYRPSYYSQDHSSGPSSSGTSYQQQHPSTGQSSGSYNSDPRQGGQGGQGGAPAYSNYPPPYDNSGNGPRYGAGPPPQSSGQYGAPPPYNYSAPGSMAPNYGPGGPPPSGGPYDRPPSGMGSYGAFPPNQGMPQSRGPYNDHNAGRPINPKNATPTIGTMTSPFSKAPSGPTNQPPNNSNRNSGKNKGRRSDRRRDRNRDNRNKPSKKEAKDRNTRDNDHARSDKAKETSRPLSPPPSLKRKEPPSESGVPRFKTAAIDRNRGAVYQHSLVSTGANFLELRQRYHKMIIPKDFIHFKRIWPSSELLGQIPTDYNVPFHCRTETDASSKLEEETGDRNYDTESRASDGVMYQAKILLYGGRREMRKSHISNSYRFIVGRKGRCELFCIGGAWSSSVDGGDPATDQSVLQRTAVRYCKSFCSLNLESVPLIPFAQIEYQRPAGRDISVIFIPSLWKLSLHEIRSLVVPVSESASMELDEPKVEGDTAAASSEENTNQTETEQRSPPQDESNKEADDVMEDELSTTPEEPLEASFEEPQRHSEDAENSSSDKMVTASSVDEAEAAQEGTKEEVQEKEEMAVETDSVISEATQKQNTEEIVEATPTDGKDQLNELEIEKDPEPKTIELVTRIVENAKLKALDLSLHGLLEYDETDDAEKTFEVSLSGEIFSDLLKREWGLLIRKALDAYRAQRAKILREIQEGLPPAKKQKLDDESHSPNEQEDVGTEKNTEEENETLTEEVKRMNEELLREAFEFFDKRDRGSFRPEQLEDILYSLEEKVSVREVEELVDPLIDADSGRILYKKLISNGVLTLSPPE